MIRKWGSFYIKFIHVNFVNNYDFFSSPGVLVFARNRLKKEKFHLKRGW